MLCCLSYVLYGQTKTKRKLKNQHYKVTVTLDSGFTYDHPCYSLPVARETEALVITSINCVSTKIVEINSLEYNSIILDQRDNMLAKGLGIWICF